MYNGDMSLTRKQVDHIAELAKLSLTEEEKTRFQGQLSEVLDYVQRLQELDTDDIPPTSTVLPLRSVMRADAVKPSAPTATLLANAPKASGDSFAVPVVLE